MLILCKQKRNIKRNYITEGQENKDTKRQTEIDKQSDKDRQTEIQCYTRVLHWKSTKPMDLPALIQEH